jgi:peptidyl-prolyl cis-trans isomerase D
VYEFGNRYVIAQLTQIREKGIPELEQIKGELTFELRKEKKGKILSDKLKGTTDLNALATKINGKVMPATEVSFHSFQLPGAGKEPNVLAYATTIDLNKISEPIIGNMGVYVIKVNNKKQAPETKDFSAQKFNISQMLQSRASYEAYKVLKDSKEIEDFRNKFY